MAANSPAARAHNAFHDYRIALDAARRNAQSLAEAARRAGEAARRLQPYVPFPVPAIEWRGAPPIAEWLEGLEALAPAFKEGLRA